MKPTIWGMAALLLLTAASSGLAEEESTDAIDCSAFRKEDYGYFVTKTTRIATPPLDVTLPKGMPIRRGQKEAAVQGKDLAEVIDQNCASLDKGARNQIGGRWHEASTLHIRP